MDVYCRRRRRRRPLIVAQAQRRDQPNDAQLNGRPVDLKLVRMRVAL